MNQKLFTATASAALLIISLTFLALQGIKSIENQDGIQFYADSSTYHQIVQGNHFVELDETGLVSVASNFFGPILILKILNNNYYLISALNILILYISVINISKLYKIKSFKLLLVLLANPITISSLLSINKEIISLLFISVFLQYLSKRTVLLLSLSIFLALMVRWQLIIFIIVVVIYYSKINFLFKKTWHYAFALLLMCSFLYVLTESALSAVRLNFENSVDAHDGSGIWIKLIDAQNSGYYFLVFPLKAAQLLFGLIPNISNINSPYNFYNDVIQVLSSLATLILLFSLTTRKMTTKNNLFFISLLYLIIFCLSPIFTPRYLYPVYLMWSILVLINNKKY